MKKLLLAFVVMASVVHDASAMIFNKDGKVFLPVVDDIEDAEWSPKASQDWLGKLEGLEGEARKQKIKALCSAFNEDRKEIRENFNNSMVSDESAISLYEGSSYNKDSRYNCMKVVNGLDNCNFNRSVETLKRTGGLMRGKLGEVSWLQWLWEYRACRSYQKSIQDLDDEVAVSDDQDRVVTRCKNAMNPNRRFTYRDVFTRSSMPKDLSESVRIARE